MQNLHVGKTVYQISDGDAEIALAHAIGRAFIELQQLEFSTISALEMLSAIQMRAGLSFDFFSSKTFGNLLREMDKHESLQEIAVELRAAKTNRDFFVHRFLFDRYGGDLMTNEDEYEKLIQDAYRLATEFAQMRKRFHDAILEKSPVEMIAVKVDPATGEFVIVESEFLKRKSKTS